jgi:hypothetical protein
MDPMMEDKEVKIYSVFSSEKLLCGYDLTHQHFFDEVEA